MDAADLAYRSATLEAVVIAAQEDLGGLWQSLLNDEAEAAAMGLRRALPEVAREYGSLAGDNAVVWYEDLRPQGARSYRVRPFVPSSLANAEGLTTWAVSPLFGGDDSGAWERVSGTLQKLVTDHDRTTVEENAERDPAVWGWRRRASADACAYCAYMAVVLDQPDYHTAAKAYHDHCRCTPVMAFRGDTIPDQPNGDEWRDVFDRAYREIDREQTALRRQWRASGGRSRNFFRQYPHLSLTTKNILARARRLEPTLFRDGVRLAA